MGKKQEKPKKYIASCSFGKDSIATILIALEHGEPLDGICYCEVMYDNKRDISAEHPEHREFIYQTAIPYFEERGIKTTVLRPEYDFMHEFYRKRQSGPYAGKYNGFPLSGLCLINKNCKMRAINSYNTQLKRVGYSPVHYVGIAADEKKRLLRLENSVDISLLEKYGVTEAAATEICEAAGLLSPLYDYAKRGGCWFCPNAKEEELQRIWELHPEWLRELAELEKTPELIAPYFNGFKKIKPSDIVEKFYWQDQQMTIFDFLGEEEH